MKPLDGLTAVGKVYDIVEGPLAGVQVIRLSYKWVVGSWEGQAQSIKAGLEENIGLALSDFGFAFCDAFKYKHLAVGVEYACGINFAKGTTAHRWEDISCPECRNAGAVRLTMMPFTDGAR